MNRRIAVGQHLAVGFSGPEMTEELIQNICTHKIGNIILFESNVTDKVQLKRLCDGLTALILRETGHPPLISMDQEGGVVSRLQEDATLFPSAMAIAAGDDPEAARTVGRVTAQELRAMGVNFNLAPVLDVNINPLNPVIGVRSYGDEPDRVARFGLAMAQGLTEGGVLCSAKHFPGHGDTAVDSHIGLPRMDKTLDALLACELKPFQAAIDAGVQAIMTSHILFSALEPEPIPATMSRRIITDLLKTRMGFRGLVVSDCMMMGAIEQYYGTVAGSVAAVAAGVDLVYISHSAALAAKAIDALEAALDAGKLDAAEFDESTQRLLTVKANLTGPSPSLDAVGSPAHRALSAQMTQAAITLVQDAPFTLGAYPLFVGPHRFRPTLVSGPEDLTLSFADALRSLLGGKAILCTPDPTEAEIASILEQAASCTSLVIGTCQARQRPGQLALVHAAITLNLPICVVALRDPYDLAALPAQVHTLAAYDYDARTLAVLGEVLAGRAQAGGRLPVRL